MSIYSICSLGGQEAVTGPLEWERVHCFDKDVAVMFLRMVKGQAEALITSVSKKEKQKERPIALNTVELMRGKK